MPWYIGPCFAILAQTHPQVSDRTLAHLIEPDMQVVQEVASDLRTCQVALQMARGAIVHKPNSVVTDRPESCAPLRLEIAD
jgi:hypothetical protein